MNLYIDIDGVLLDYATQAPAENVGEFIDYIIDEFDCYWLTTHCQGDSVTAIEYLSEYLPECIVRKLSSVKPTEWKVLKTGGIDFSKPFVWLDDYPFRAEMDVLEANGASDSLFRVCLENENELLLNAIEFLKIRKQMERA